MDRLSIPFQEAHQLVPSEEVPEFSGRFQRQGKSAEVESGCSAGLGTPTDLRNESLKGIWTSELCPHELDAVAPYLWCLSTQSSASITPLHHQIIKGRDVVITESPRLHLLWADRRVFIKPIPEPLLSYGYWASLETLARHDADYRNIQRCALGYIRTYVHLIRHQSDFRLAQEKHLVPASATWAAVRPFLADLGRIADADVSPRYRYGELRLGRLNWYAPLLFGRWDYEALHWEYGDYFAHFYGPFLFAFGTLSTALSALQVGLAVDQLVPAPAQAWAGAWAFCRGLGAAVFLLVVLVLLVLAAMYAWLVADEWVFALRARYGKKKPR